MTKTKTKQRVKGIIRIDLNEQILSNSALKNQAPLPLADSNFKKLPSKLQEIKTGEFCCSYEMKLEHLKGKMMPTVRYEFDNKELEQHRSQQFQSQATIAAERDRMTKRDARGRLEELT